MSVLIKGMKKPDNCEVCPYAFCHLDTRNCPIAEIPDHGDLIDRDALKNELFFDTADCDLEMIEFERVSGAPVVIPAERSEDAAN